MKILLGILVDAVPSRPKVNCGTEISIPENLPPSVRIPEKKQGSSAPVTVAPVIVSFQSYYAHILQVRKRSGISEIVLTITRVVLPAPQGPICGLSAVALA